MMKFISAVQWFFHFFIHMLARLHFTTYAMELNRVLKLSKLKIFSNTLSSVATRNLAKDYPGYFHIFIELVLKPRNLQVSSNLTAIRFL